MKIRCFKYGQKGQLKKDCPKPCIYNVYVVETCLVDNYNDKWIISLEATNAMVQTKQPTQ